MCAAPAPAAGHFPLLRPACEDPNVMEMADACRFLKLECDLEVGMHTPLPLVGNGCAASAALHSAARSLQLGCLNVAVRLAGRRNHSVCLPVPPAAGQAVPARLVAGAGAAARDAATERRQPGQPRGPNT